MHIFKHKFIEILLQPLSFLYYLVILMRNLAYDAGIFKIFAPGVKVISVGNITVGGTGKTPATIFLANALQNAGISVAILSRGYGRRSHSAVLVSAGDGPLCEPGEAGDEPYLMAEKTRSVPIVVDRDRVNGARWLKEQFAPEVILLDDGFQHRRLARTLDMVLLDIPASNRSLLPAGPFREPFSALKRADLIFINDATATSAGPCEQAKATLKKYTTAPLFGYSKAKSGLRFPLSHNAMTLDELKGVAIFALSGIANPNAFRESLASTGAQIVGERHLRDHATYDIGRIRDVLSAFKKANASLLITTDKDWIKLKKYPWPNDVPVAVLEIAFATDDHAVNHLIEHLKKAQ